MIKEILILLNIKLMIELEFQMKDICLVKEIQQIGDMNYLKFMK